MTKLDALRKASSLLESAEKRVISEPERALLEAQVATALVLYSGAVL